MVYTHDGYDHPGYERRPRRRGCGCGCLSGLVVLLLVLVGLLVAAEVGLRTVAADRIEKEASTRIGAPVDAGFGASPLLFALVDHRVRTLHLTTDGSSTVPRLDLTASDTEVSLPAGLSAEGASATVGTVDGTATVTDEQLTETAAAKSGGGPLGEIGRIRSVRSDPASGTLLVGLAAGVEVGVRPTVSGNTLQFEPVQAEVAGVPVPSGLVQAVTSAVQSRLDSLPDGLTADRARVVPGGLELHLTGRDVPLEK